MAQTRPRTYPTAKPPTTDAQRLTQVERVTGGLPPTGSIFASGRPDSSFGSGDADQTWPGMIGDGVTTRFPIAGRLATDPARYRVTVGGVVQDPATAYSLPTTAEAVDFAEPPPNGCAVAIAAPFYRSA